MCFRLPTFAVVKKIERRSLYTLSVALKVLLIMAALGPLLAVRVIIN